MIVVAVEHGINVDEICHHLNVCKKKEKETPEQRSKNAVKVFREFCAKLTGNRGEYMKIVS